MKKALRCLADFSERSLRDLAQAFVPLINLIEHLLSPQPRTTLHRISMEHFNLRPTCFSRTEIRRRSR